MKRIAVMTSGGDAPGMNAAIRAVVRAGIAEGLEVYGIRRAYEGLLTGDFERLTSREVSGILQRGGTILQTARNEEFKTKRGQNKALRRLNEQGIDAVIVNGSVALSDTVISGAGTGRFLAPLRRRDRRGGHPLSRAVAVPVAGRSRRAGGAGGVLLRAEAVRAADGPADRADGDRAAADAFGGRHPRAGAAAPGDRGLPGRVAGRARGGLAGGRADRAADL